MYPHHRAILVEARNLPRQVLRTHHVVLMEYSDDRRACDMQRAIPVGGNAEPVRISVYPDASITELVDNRERPVIGRVVDDDELEVGEGLREDAGDRVADVHFAVTDRKAGADRRCRHGWLVPSSTCRIFGEMNLRSAASWLAYGRAFANKSRAASSRAVLFGLSSTASAALLHAE